MAFGGLLGGWGERLEASHGASREDAPAVWGTDRGVRFMVSAKRIRSEPHGASTSGIRLVHGEDLPGQFSAA